MVGDDLPRAFGSPLGPAEGAIDDQAALGGPVALAGDFPSPTSFPQDERKREQDAGLRPGKPGAPKWLGQFTKKFESL